MKFYQLVIIFCSFYLSFPNTVFGQPSWTKARVQQIVNEAMELSADSQWEAAIEHLDNNLESINETRRFRSYKAFLYFSKAYLHQNRQTGNKEENLSLAQSAYKSALQNQPGDTKIINNLIWVSRSLGDWDTALEYAEYGLRTDSLQNVDWILIKGDLYRDKGDPKSACKTYTLASEKDPENHSASQKLLALFQHNHLEDLNLLYQKCLEFKTIGQEELALEGLEFIMSKECQIDSAIRDSVILTWAGILAANNWVKPALGKRLAKMNCSYPPIALLKSNITKRWLMRLPPDSWWSNNGRHRFYYIALQKSWADFLLSRGKKEQALDLYLACQKSIKNRPDYSREIYGKPSELEIDLMTKLARLYGDSMVSDDDFKELESHLFRKKGYAYERGDLESIQKYHTILALIYVDRKKWGGVFAQNAEFQLKRAIETNKRRTERDPTLYTPLPHLYKYLGETYTALRKSEKAAEAYLNSAVDYLETDNLKYSKDMMKKADEHITPLSKRATRQKKGDVESILNTRENINTLDKNSFNKDSQSYFRNNTSYEWLDNPNKIKTIDDSVIERQSFKVLADLGNRAKTVGAKKESDTLKKEAGNKVNDFSVLSSQQDVIRIKQIEPTNQLFDYRSIKSNEYIIDNQPKSKDKNKVILPNRSGKQLRTIDLKNKEIKK